MADSDFLRESGYGSWMVTGEDVPDNWGDCVEKRTYVRKKINTKSRAKIMYICAVDGDSSSKPIKIYRWGKDVKLPEIFVLRIDSAPDRSNGSKALMISNSNLRLIATHNKANLAETLKGFRARVDGEVYITAKLYTENREC
jgi:hypothetical protein